MLTTNTMMYCPYRCKSIATTVGTTDDQLEPMVLNMVVNGEEWMCKVCGMRFVKRRDFVYIKDNGKVPKG